MSTHFPTANERYNRRERYVMGQLDAIVREFAGGRDDAIPVVCDVDVVGGYTTLSTAELRTLEHCTLEDVMTRCEKLPDRVAREILDEVTDR